MKLNRILFAALIASITGSSITSCSESFLDENLTTQYSTDRFKTQEGLDELVTGAYQKLKFKFNYIWGIQCYKHTLGRSTLSKSLCLFRISEAIWWCAVEISSVYKRGNIFYTEFC